MTKSDSDKAAGSHYDFPNGVQVLDITRHLCFREGSIVKYLCRLGRKDGESRLADLLKCQKYLDDLISTEIDKRAGAEAVANAQVESCRDAGRPLKACGGCNGKPKCPFWSEAPEGSETPSEQTATPKTCLVPPGSYTASESLSGPLR